MTKPTAAALRLDYHEQGPADAIPVVFLHGVTDSWRSFERVLRLLPPSIRAIAISQRGHGDSARPETGYTYRDFSEDLREFLDARSIARAVVIGHSMGAMVAQRFAIDHPERLAGLVLVGALSTLYRDPAIAEFVASAIDPLRDPIPPGFALEWQLSTAVRPLPPAFLDTVVLETRKVPSRVWRASFHGFLDTPDFSHELAAITAPTLLVWGDRDAYVPRAQQEALLARIPHARLSVHHGAGHALHWEDPAAFADEIVGALSRN